VSKLALEIESFEQLLLMPPEEAMPEEGRDGFGATIATENIHSIIPDTIEQSTPRGGGQPRDFRRDVVKIFGPQGWSPLRKIVQVEPPFLTWWGTQSQQVEQVPGRVELGAKDAILPEAEAHKRPQRVASIRPNPRIKGYGKT
jgi:hypothetical protein